ncbi:MAG: anti-sigma factor [Dehalococcoidia bacterium]
MTCNDYRELCEAAAVRALDPADQAALDQHLAGCLDCRAELGRSEGLAAWLAVTVPQIDPPLRLKQSIMQVVRLEARPQPIARAAATARRFSWPAFQLGRLAAVGAAAALLVAAGLGAWSYALSGELESQRQLNASLTQGLQGRDDLVQLVSSQPELMSFLNGTPEAPTGRGRMYASSINDTALLLVDGLKPLPPDRVYQVWLMQGGSPVSGGTFTVDGLGQGRWVVRADDPLSRYQAVIVTEEPAGGSAAPTSPRVLTGLF